MISDYEFARTHALIRPSWIMVPEVIPDAAVHAERSRILRYPGIKEDVYVPRFRVDEGVPALLGLRPGDLVVTMRPPATEAHYHNPEAEDLFRVAVDRLAADPRTRIIMLPRDDRQGAFVRASWPQLVESGKLIFPPRVLDGLNVIWHSDLVISGGGTMNREAAALGVPVYSIFRGPTGAVDRFLVSVNRLVMITSANEVHSNIPLVYRQRGIDAQGPTSQALNTIVQHIVQIQQNPVAAVSAERQATVPAAAGVLGSDGSLVSAEKPVSK